MHDCAVRDEIERQGQVARAAVAALVSMRLAEEAGGAVPEGTGWRDELRRLKHSWAAAGKGIDPPDLDLILDRVYHDVRRRPGARDREQALQDYVAGPGTDL